MDAKKGVIGVTEPRKENRKEKLGGCTRKRVGNVRGGRNNRGRRGEEP